MNALEAIFGSNRQWGAGREREGTFLSASCRSANQAKVESAARAACTGFHSSLNTPLWCHRSRPSFTRAARVSEPSQFTHPFQKLFEGEPTGDAH